MIKSKSHITVMWAVAIGLVLVISLGAGPAFAQGNLHFGRLKVELGLKYELRYEDNIYSEKNNEQDDLIHIATPAISLAYEGDRPENYFKAGYYVDLAAYSDFSDNNYQAHHPYVDMGYKTAAGLYFRASDRYLSTADPYGSNNQYGVGAKTKRVDNTANLLLGYEFFKRYAIEGFYTNYLIKYDLTADEWQDRTDNTGGGNLVYNLSPKTALFAQYRYTQADYDKQNDGVLGWSAATSQDYTKNDFFVGVRFNPGSKLEGELKVGYGTKEFDNQFDVLGNKYEDDSGWISETQIAWQARERTRLTLDLRRSFEGSPDAVSSSYIDTTVGLGLIQNLANRLSANLAFKYNNNDYQNEVAPNPSKAFDIYTATAGLNYEIKKWLTTGIEYEYTSKNASNAVYETSEFDRNAVKFTIAGKF